MATQLLSIPLELRSKILKFLLADTDVRATFDWSQLHPEDKRYHWGRSTHEILPWHCITWPFPRCALEGSPPILWVNKSLRRELIDLQWRSLVRYVFPSTLALLDVLTQWPYEALQAVRRVYVRSCPFTLEPATPNHIWDFNQCNLASVLPVLRGMQLDLLEFNLSFRCPGSTEVLEWEKFDLLISSGWKQLNIYANHLHTRDWVITTKRLVERIREIRSENDFLVEFPADKAVSLDPVSQLPEWIPGVHMGKGRWSDNSYSGWYHESWPIIDGQRVCPSFVEPPHVDPAVVHHTAPTQDESTAMDATNPSDTTNAQNISDPQATTNTQDISDPQDTANAQYATDTPNETSFQDTTNAQDATDAQNATDIADNPAETDITDSNRSATTITNELLSVRTAESSMPTSALGQATDASEDNTGSPPTQQPSTEVQPIRNSLPEHVLRGPRIRYPELFPLPRDINENQFNGSFSDEEYQIPYEPDFPAYSHYFYPIKEDTLLNLVIKRGSKADIVQDGALLQMPLASNLSTASWPEIRLTQGYLYREPRLWATAPPDDRKRFTMFGEWLQSSEALMQSKQ